MKMKSFSRLSFFALFSFLALSTFISICDARGGRGRGGGSFGGIFGGWRKYKKPSSSSNSRRTISGSPVLPTVNKPSSNSNIGASYSSSSAGKNLKTHASYPKQQMPAGSNYNHYNGYYGNGGPGAAHLPPGSSYYPSAAGVPQGAIYYPQSPMRSSSSGTGDIIFGVLAGHALGNMLFRPRQHVTNVYYPNPEQNPEQNGRKVIIVNNGEQTALDDSESPEAIFTSSSEEEDEGHYWPTDTDTPLAPFLDSNTPQQSGIEPIFQRNKLNNFPNTHMPQAARETSANLNEQFGAETPNARDTVPFNGGIICTPVVLNETDPTDPSKVQQVDRIVCYPAPPPPVQASVENADVSCVIRTFIETDPNDPSQTIEVPKEICTTTTTTAVPPQVAGEIGENVTTEVETASTAAPPATTAAEGA